MASHRRPASTSPSVSRLLCEDVAEQVRPEPEPLPERCRRGRIAQMRDGLGALCLQPLDRVTSEFVTGLVWQTLIDHQGVDLSLLTAQRMRRHSRCRETAEFAVTVGTKRDEVVFSRC